MAGGHTGGDGDLALSEVPVTVPTFFRGRHFSVSDHMEKALAGPVPQDGEKIARAPVAATDAMIAETESRLGVTLPDTLRSLYRLSDGGSLPSYWVPATADPGIRWPTHRLTGAALTGSTFSPAASGRWRSGSTSPGSAAATPWPSIRTLGTT